MIALNIGLYNQSFFEYEFKWENNQRMRGTKQAIVKAAIELFMKNGVEAVSIKDICDYCSVTRNSFYYYFVNKELLFDSIGDYISESSKLKIRTVLDDNSYYNRLWEYYRAFLESELEVGPDIMNHCCVSRTAKGFADKYSYVDEKLYREMNQLISYAKAAGEIKTTAANDDLVWISYAVIRGANIKWCFQWGESDLLWDAARGLDTLFLPAEGFRLLDKFKR